MFNAKKSFMAEVDKIVDSTLKETALKIVEDVPEYFWNLPASSTGKYHPQCDLGAGGLVRHSIMTAIIAYDLVIAEIFVEDTQINRDLAIFTGLFHDILKYGENSTFTEFTHPIMSGIFVKDRLKSSNVNEDLSKIICNAIYSHMGKWNTSNYNPGIKLDVPITSFQKLIHTADYMSSRTYIGGLSDWGYIFKNKNYELTDKDKQILLNAIEKNHINEDYRLEIGIIRSDDEILEIWKSMVERNSISERQAKYLALANKSI